MLRVNLMLTLELHKRLRHYAFNKGVSMSEIVRRAIVAYLEKN